MNQFINRDEAMIILKKMLSNKSLIIHSMTVAMVMVEYASNIDVNIDSLLTSINNKIKSKERTI